MTRSRTGVSKLALPVALVVILVVAGGYLFLSRSPTTSTSSSQSSSSSSSTPSVTLRTEVDQLIQYINGRNIDGLATFYTQNSVEHWSGNTGGLQGLYTGVSNIRLLYATSVGKTSVIDVNSSNYAEHVFSPTHINATYRLVMLANSTTVGKLNATIDVSQEWNWGSGGWQISRENWSYAYFDASLIDAKLISSTTFPQWGVMEAGGNPNLVSEKSFEWNAGPLLAAGVYAFLLTIVVVVAAGFISRDRGPRRQGQTAHK
jgi:hypothetical protein